MSFFLPNQASQSIWASRQITDSSLFSISLKTCSNSIYAEGRIPQDLSITWYENTGNIEYWEWTNVLDIEYLCASVTKSSKFSCQMNKGSYKLHGSLRNAGAQFKCNFLSSSEVSGYSNVFNFNGILHLNFFNYTLQFVLNYKSLETWWFNLGAAITITSFAKYIFLITTKSQPNEMERKKTDIHRF